MSKNDVAEITKLNNLLADIDRHAYDLSSDSLLALVNDFNDNYVKFLEFDKADDPMWPNALQLLMETYVLGVAINNNTVVDKAYITKLNYVSVMKSMHKLVDNDCLVTFLNNVSRSIKDDQKGINGAFKFKLNMLGALASTSTTLKAIGNMATKIDV